VVIATVPGARRKVLEPAAMWLTRRWPAVFAAVALVIGLGLAATGIVGLARE
jgi:hypothetical protein